MAKIIWSNPALEDLHQIQEYYAPSAPGYASKLLDTLINRAQQLLAFLKMGRLVPEVEDDVTRELISGSYRIIYRVHSETPLIIYVARVHPTAKSLDTLALS